MLRSADGEERYGPVGGRPGGLHQGVLRGGREAAGRLPGRPRTRRDRHQRNARHHPAGGRIRAEGGGRRMHGGHAHIFGDPGRPASGVYVLESMGPACVSKEFAAFALKKTSPITVWLRKLAARSTSVVAARGRRRRHVLHRRLRAGHDGRRHRAGAGAQPTVPPFPALQEAQGGRGHFRRRPGPGQGADGPGRLPPRPALQQRPLLLRGALRHLAA
jgi:hypothetical protein